MIFLHKRGSDSHVIKSRVPVGLWLDPGLVIGWLRAVGRPQCIGLYLVIVCVKVEAAEPAAQALLLQLSHCCCCDQLF